MIGLAIMVYEPLYHALHIWSVYVSVQNWKQAEVFFSIARTTTYIQADCTNFMGFETTQLK